MTASERGEPRWLTRLAVDAIHHGQIREHGGRPGVRDEDRIESALARPRDRRAYDEDADLAELAAAYAHDFARGHGYVDGNERTALMAAYTFLAVNGYHLDAPEPEAAAVVRELAGGELSEEEVVAAWIRQVTEGL